MTALLSLILMDKFGRVSAALCKKKKRGWAMKKLLLSVALIVLAPMAQAGAADIDLPASWSGFYIGVHGGYGAGKSDLTVPGAGSTSQEMCRTNSFGDIPLLDAPAGSVFQSALSNNQRYPALIASILGLEPISGSTLFSPTTQTAWDFRGQTPFVADDECIFHTAYALSGGNYYGGRQDPAGPLFPIAGLPPDFVPQDSSGTIVTTTTPGTGDAELDTDLSGFLGGVQAGWNHQLNDSIVIGLEGDFAIASIDGDNDVGGGTVTTDIDWLSSFRARLGVTRNNWLLFVTGGAAIAGTSVSYKDGMQSLSDSATQLGWTAGGGAEMMISDSLSLKAEYKFFDLGEASYNLDGNKVKTDITLNTFVVGLNKHF